jgi:hypothetical protein
MALNGSLDDYSPAGALRVLSSTGKTGAVRFSGAAGCTVYLNRGQLYFARDETTDQALATALVRPDRLTAEQWAEAIEQAGDSPRVGELLVSNGAIDPDLLASVALSVVYDPLIQLFREGDGAFDFEPDTVHWIGPFRTFNVDAIVNEVRRRVREVDEMSPLVPSIDSWVTPRRTLPGNAVQVTLLREDWELVTVLAGARTITELASDMGRGRYSTARVVHRLAQAGLVDVEAQFPTADAAKAPDDLSELDHMLGHEPWHQAAPDGPASDAAAPTTRGDGFDLHPALNDDQTDAGAWALPHRQPVAVDDEPAGDTRTAPWHPSEDLDIDDPAAQNHIPGLEGINGFRNAIGAESTAEAAAEHADLHPNAVWLENLYAEYMEEPEVNGKKRKKEMLDVAFSAQEHDDANKIGTLRRLMDALKKL